jgi:hypothetical protein
MTEPFGENEKRVTDATYYALFDREFLDPL